MRWTTTDWRSCAPGSLGSRGQLVAMASSADPGPLLHELAIFPPSATDIDG